MENGEHPPNHEAGVPAPQEPSETAEPRSARRWLLPLLTGVGVVLFGLAIASQVYLITALDDTRSDLQAIQGQIAEVDSSVAVLSADVEVIANEPSSQQPSSSPAAGIPEGYLPRFVNGEPDTAVGLKLATISGPDAYGDTIQSIDPADGKKRVWMIWAHWCPYCQEELPALASSYEAYRLDYPDIEIATVTSSIDPSRGNPLESYLAQEQFPFPVIIDTDSQIAGQMGISAFPFWMVTDGDGTVLLRVAGLMPPERLQALLASLDSYEA